MADLSTTVVRVAKVGSIIVAHSDLSVITHAERLDGVPASCRHIAGHRQPSSKRRSRCEVGTSAS